MAVQKLRWTRFWIVSRNDLETESLIEAPAPRKSAESSNSTESSTSKSVAFGQVFERRFNSVISTAFPQRNQARRLVFERAHSNPASLGRGRKSQMRCGNRWGRRLAGFRPWKQFERHGGISDGIESLMLWLLQSRIQSTLPLREREVSEMSNLCELMRAPDGRNVRPTS